MGITITDFMHGMQCRKLKVICFDEDMMRK